MVCLGGFGYVHVRSVSPLLRSEEVSESLYSIFEDFGSERVDEDEKRIP